MASDPAARGPVLTLNGVGVEVPLGWECRIRQGSPDDIGTALPVLHAATVPLPSERADYGGGVVEQLTDGDVFVSLIEFGPEAVGTKLYPEVQAIPTVTPEMFHPFQLQRRIRGQAGTQSFFTLNDRAFCLYVVIGSFARRAGLANQANRLIGNLQIEPN